MLAERLDHPRPSILVALHPGHAVVLQCGGVLRHDGIGRERRPAFGQVVEHRDAAPAPIFPVRDGQGKTVRGAPRRIAKGHVRRVLCAREPDPARHRRRLDRLAGDERLKVPPEERTVLVASPGRTALSTSTSGVALVSSRQKATSSAITARI